MLVDAVHIFRKVYTQRVTEGNIIFCESYGYPVRQHLYEVLRPMMDLMPDDGLEAWRVPACAVLFT
jgi:hypothetical protein